MKKGSGGGPSRAIRVGVCERQERSHMMSAGDTSRAQCLRVAALLLTGLYSTSGLRAQERSCPTDWIEVAREQVGQAINVYCAKQGDRPRLDSLIHSIDSASHTLGCIGPMECNRFVGKIGLLMNIPYFRDVLTDPIPDKRLANRLYRFVKKAVASKASGWRAVTPEEADKLADRGRFVIGVAENKHPSPDNHGHIALVAPSWLPHAVAKDGEYLGSGPWIRSSNNGTNSVRASKQFGSSVVTPIWAVWEPTPDAP